MSTEDPRCPECGEKIGTRATYCMHCSADLTEEQAAADTDGDGDWDRDSAVADERAGPDDDSISSAVEAAAADITDATDPDPTGAGGGEGAVDESAPAPPPQSESGDELLDSDGVVDNTLTVIVGIAAGIVVGLVATITVLFTVQSAWGFLLGLLAWIASTAHLIRRDTVQGAISRGAYAVAVVLVLTSLIPLSPLVSVEGGIVGRIEGFVAVLVVVSFPAGFAAIVGYIAGRFVPE